MNQADDQLSNKPDVVAEAIAMAKKAGELRDAAIAQLLDKQAEIERNLKTLGYVASLTNGNKHKNSHDEVKPVTESQDLRTSKRFKDRSLAEIGRILLKENGTLHGKRIEVLARAGGFKGGTQNFQNYLPVAFKRDGTFVNIGGNTWKLKEEEDK